jgi:hypothetical protein
MAKQIASLYKPLKIEHSNCDREGKETIGQSVDDWKTIYRDNT